jgi:ABC-type transport system substrate-binding protein
MRKTLLCFLAGILLLSLILVGCSSGSSSPAVTATAPAASAPTAKLSTGDSSPPTSAPVSSTDYPIPLNPNAQKGGTMIFNHNMVIAFISAPADGPQLSQRTGRAVFEPLLICDATENIKPWLATSFSTSPDGKAITLKLRKGIKFTDGTDFNAEAVKFNLDLDLKNNITGSAVLKKITSCDIPDPYTITFNLSSPDATFLLILAQQNEGLMASPTAQQKPTTPDNITQIHLVGTGPFKFDSWQRDNYVQFKANPDYWQKGKPYLDGLRWNFIPDMSASLLAFRSGQANAMITLEPNDALNLKKDGFYVGSCNLKMIHNAVPDGANPDSPFAKLEVRQALEHAINKNDILALGSGFFEPTMEFAKPTDGYYDPTITPRSYDLARAKQLLASAGYPNGVPTIVVTSQTTATLDNTNLLVANLKAAGFNVTKVDGQTSAAYTTTTQKGWRSSTPGVASLLRPPFPQPDNFTGLLGRFNTTIYPDEYRPAGWSAAWVAAQEQMDTAKRNAQVKALVRQLYDNAAIVPIYFDSSRYVTDNKVQGWSDYFQTNNNADFYQPAELWLKTK